MKTTEIWDLPWVPDTPVELRLRITLLLAPNYMTTSTATVPATVLKDAQDDANRLKAAVDAVINTLGIQ